MAGGRGRLAGGPYAAAAAGGLTRGGGGAEDAAEKPLIQYLIKCPFHGRKKGEDGVGTLSCTNRW